MYTEPKAEDSSRTGEAKLTLEDAPLLQGPTSGGGLSAASTNAASSPASGSHLLGFRRRPDEVRSRYRVFDHRRGSGIGGGAAWFGRYVRRIRQLPQMDFEFALWTMLYLCTNPRLVYRSVYYQKQTKNQWARDDPAFVVLLALLVTVSAIAYGLVYASGLLEKAKLVVWMVLVDFVGLGVAVALGTWLYCNKRLVSHASFSSPDQRVEYAYAWDVHCNAFFPFFLLTHILQLLLLPVLDRDAWIARLLANTLYLAASAIYLWITFLGFSAQPFLRNTQVFLYPIAPLAVLYIISLFTFNVSRVVIHLYFGL